MPMASGSCESESLSICRMAASLMDVKMTFGSMPMPETDSMG